MSIELSQILIFFREYFPDSARPAVVWAASRHKGQDITDSPLHSPAFFVALHGVGLGSDGPLPAASRERQSDRTPHIGDYVACHINAKTHLSGLRVGPVPPPDSDGRPSGWGWFPTRRGIPLGLRQVGPRGSASPRGSSAAGPCPCRPEFLSRRVLGLGQTLPADKVGRPG